MRADAEKWDAKYKDQHDSSMDADAFVIQWAHLLSGGRALDLACGTGGNSVYLARQRYWVDAVDISFQALRRLKSRARELNLSVGCVAADLDYWPIPVATYDLVAVFYFFAPERMTDIVESLRPGGLIFYATYNIRHKSEKPHFSEAYLVPDHGLSHYFTSLDILLNEPATGDAGNVSRLIGQKP